MILISQDGRKAIDTTDILFYFVDDRTRNDRYLLMAEPRRQFTDSTFGMLILFEHEDIEVVKHVMRFLATETWLFPDGENEGCVELNIPTLYKYGMKKIGGEEIAKNRK